MAEKNKLLVADDDEKIHQLYTDCFGEEFDLFHAIDGADALMLAVEHRPDVILLDIMMPLLDGRTICKKIKSYPATKDIKIIMVTGKSDQSDRIVGFEMGADDYVEKPVSIAYLTRAVGKLLR